MPWTNFLFMLPQSHGAGRRDEGWYTSMAFGWTAGELLVVKACRGSVA
jgi:hypothetical protein